MRLCLPRPGYFSIFLLLIMMCCHPSRACAASHGLRVRDGVLTVDGLAVKSNLNVALSRWHYLYIFVPHEGTAIIAEHSFAGAREQRNAFQGSTLTVLAGACHLQLTSAGRLRGLRSAYVRFDAGTGPASPEPAISFGDSPNVPASWPAPTGAEAQRGRRMIRVRAQRSPRTGRLCRPSRRGRELCAVIREVVYQP